MRISIINCHPCASSVSHSVGKIYEEVAWKKHEVQSYSLYEDKELSSGFLRFWDDKIPSNDLEIREKRQAIIKETDTFVIVSPIWFGEMPSIFKSRFENNFGAGFAYSYRNGRPHGLLQGKKVEFYLSCDGPSWLYWIFPSPIWLVWKYLRFGMCGISLTHFTILSKVRIKKKSDKIKAYLEKLREKLIKRYTI